MKIISFRLHKLVITNILIIALCLLCIILILQTNTKTNVFCNANTDICTDFLNKYNWLIDRNSEIIDDVIIKDDNSVSFSVYKKIQLEQGFDITPYINKTVEKHSFAVLNYPEINEGIYANVFLYNGKIIAADICSIKLNGFIHGVIRNNEQYKN